MIFTELKLAAIGVGLITCVGLYFYISSLNNKVYEVTQEIGAVKVENKVKEEVIKETDRRVKINDKITEEFNLLEDENLKEAQQKELEIKEDVKQGKDRPVGPLLIEFFNSVYNKN